MTTDVTDQLRAGIERVPAHVPPGLARSAYRRYRRRRVTVRSIAAAGSAVAAGIAAAVLLPGPATPASQDAAYVVSHVTQALGALPSNTIFFDRMTHGGGSWTTDRWRVLGRSRTEVFTASGQLVSESGHLVTPTTSQAVWVDYQHKYWWRRVNSNGYGNARQGLPPGYTCGEDGPDIIGMDNAGQFAAWLRAEVSCGQLTTGGTEAVDGVSAVRLTASNKQETLSYWVNPTTYLPVRVTVAIPSGILMQDDLQWLRPTAANLAKLNLPVPPAGFTQVPSNGCIASGTCSPWTAPSPAPKRSWLQRPTGDQWLCQAAQQRLLPVQSPASACHLHGRYAPRDGFRLAEKASGSQLRIDVAR